MVLDQRELNMNGNDAKKSTPQSCQISLVVCTYNRASLLDLCLQQLLKQTPPSSSFEVIVVDNNSPDNTKAVVANHARDRVNVRYILETKQGLSHARNRGFQEAVAEYVAYIDDDAKVAEDWLEKALGILRDHQPDVFGGPIYPFYLTPKPEWFKDSYEIRIHQPQTGWFATGSSGYLSGSNICFRKSLLQEYGGFNPKLGMSGTELGYGEETEIVQRALKEARKIYYSLDLKVYHLVPEHKMQLWYHLYSNYKWGKDNVSRRRTKFSADAVFELAAYIDAMMKGVNEHIQTREEKRTPHLEQVVVEDYAKTIREIGRRVGCMLDADETVQMRSMLKRSPDETCIGFRELLTVNLKLLRRTKAVKTVVGWVRGRHGNSAE